MTGKGKPGRAKAELCGLTWFYSGSLRSSHACQTHFPMSLWARNSLSLMEVIPCNLPAVVPNVNLAKKRRCIQSMFWLLISNILATLCRIPLGDDRCGDCRKTGEQPEVTIKFFLWSVTFWKMFRGQIFSCFCFVSISSLMEARPIAFFKTNYWLFLSLGWQNSQQRGTYWGSALIRLTVQRDRDCDGLNEIAPTHILRHLNTWSPVGSTVWGCLRDVALLEEVCHRDSPSGFKVTYCSQFNLISVILLVVQGSISEDTEEPPNQTTHGQKKRFIGE